MAPLTVVWTWAVPVLVSVTVAPGSTPPESSSTVPATRPSVVWASAGVAAAMASLDLTRLAPYHAGLLSAGQKRRLALARLALVPRPLWLLDEPTVGLDTASQDRLAKVMSDHLAKGGLILAATHVALGFEPQVKLDLGRAS